MDIGNFFLTLSIWDEYCHSKDFACWTKFWVASLDTMGHEPEYRD